MKKLIMLTLLGIVQLAAGVRAVAMPSDPPTVTITLAHRRPSHALVFHWKITNGSSQEIVIYSTFLHGPVLEHQQDANGDIELYTSLRAKLDVGVYYFPKAEFISLRPGESAEGDLNDPLKSGRWVSRSSKIILNVSYGSNLPAIQDALKQQFLHGRGHPANPIVDWQQLARSNVLELK